MPAPNCDCTARCPCLWDVIGNAPFQPSLQFGGFQLPEIYRLYPRLLTPTDQNVKRTIQTPSRQHPSQLASCGPQHLCVKHRTMETKICCLEHVGITSESSQRDLNGPYIVQDVLYMSFYYASCIVMLDLIDSTDRWSNDILQLSHFPQHTRLPDAGLFAVCLRWRKSANNPNRSTAKG